MNKKSTRTAYAVAIVAIVVLLGALAMMYKDVETGFVGTCWSLMPPVVAIALALISKEVYSSLFMGCLVGALLYTQFSPWDTIVQLVGGDYGIVTTVSDSYNMGIIVFLVMLGIIVDLMNKGGGSEAFGRWANTSVKSRWLTEHSVLHHIIYRSFECVINAVLQHHAVSSGLFGSADKPPAFF